MEVMSYREIAQKLQKESPHLRINSPQTARNVCIRALKKIKFIVEYKDEKEKLYSFFEILKTRSNK